MKLEGTPEQQAALGQIGQRLVDRLNEEMMAAGIDDLQGVLSVLVSMTAHYIGGIPDQGMRDRCYQQYGHVLSVGIDHVAGSGNVAPVSFSKEVLQ